MPARQVHQVRQVQLWRALLVAALAGAAIFFLAIYGVAWLFWQIGLFNIFAGEAPGTYVAYWTAISAIALVGFWLVFRRMSRR